jgi:hypothetical protein
MRRNLCLKLLLAMALFFTFLPMFIFLVEKHR